MFDFVGSIIQPKVGFIFKLLSNDFLITGDVDVPHARSVTEEGKSLIAPP